jgi:hypothetical protein
MRTTILPCITATLAASACIPTITDDLSTVEKPRLLAVAAAPAEVTPGADVTLTALVAAPPGARRSAVDWELCVERKPLTDLGAVSPACLHPGESDGSVADTVGRGETVSTELPRQACSLFGPNPPPPQGPGDPGGRPVDPDPTGGYYQPVVAFLAAEPTLGAVRLSCGVPGLSPDQRAEFGERYRINENPRIDEVVADGQPLSVDPAAEPATVRRGAKVTLTAEWAKCPKSAVCGDGICGEREDATSCADDCPAGASKGCTGAETYAWFDSAAGNIVDRREGIAITWYSTAGDFSERRVGLAESDPEPETPHVATSWAAPTKAGEQTLWAVIRDDRGGVSWSTYQVRVE